MIPSGALAHCIKAVIIAAGVAASVAALSVSASADAVTLTEAQTLALYGTEIHGEYYSGDPYDASDMGGYMPITFRYAYPLSSIGYMDTGGGFSGNQNSDFTPAQINNDIRYLRGLVYIADSSQWGNGYFPTNNAVLHQDNYNNNKLYNLELPMSISITNISDMVQYVGWSTSYFSLGYMYKLIADGYSDSNAAFYAYRDNNRAIVDFCDWELTTLSGVNPSGKALRSPNITNSDGKYVTGFKNLPMYPYYASDGNPLDESQLAKFSFFRISGGAVSGNTFDVNGINLGAQALSPLYQHNSGQGAAPPSGDIAIIIGCPKLYDYTPPPVVTTTAQTTRPETRTTRTFTTVEPVLPVTMPTEITDIPLNVINDNLTRIIQLLNNIYIQITINNELTQEQQQQLYNPDLQDGEQLEIMDNAMSNQVKNALTSYTYPTIPEDIDENSGEFLGYIVGRFQAVEWVFMLGMFSLSLAVASYVIFRRGV